MIARDREVRVLATGTALPEHIITQDEAREFARVLFGAARGDVDQRLSIFDNAGIERRHVARPLEWFAQPRGFGEKNAVYREVALDLAEKAARRALDRSGLAGGDLAGIVFVSSTGLSTPSLDTHLIQRLDLRRDVARLPLWGLGCAGGGGGLARAAQLARALGGPVLLIAVELCSVTFVHGDRRLANLVAAALFADGAAAVIVGPGDTGPAVIADHARLFDDTEDVMGWDVTDAGLHVRFARSIPDIVSRHMPAIVEEAARAAGVDDFDHFVVHPGGPRVLEAYAGSLGVSPDRFHHSVEVLRECGNMSSPTVLFVLERFLQNGVAPGETGFVVGLGPGFCAEGVVLRW